MANMQKLEKNLEKKRVYVNSTKLIFKRLNDLIDTYGSVTCRFLPDNAEKNPDNIVIKGTHFIPLKVKNKDNFTGEITEDIAKKAERCLQTYEKPCSVCEIVENLAESDDEDILTVAQDIQVNWSWCINTVVRELTGEIGEKSVVLDINSIGAQNKLRDLLKMDENACDLQKGRDLIFSRNPNNRHIEVTVADNRSPLFSTQKAIDDVVNSQPNLSKLGLKKVKTYEQLKNIVKISLATVYDLQVEG
jgi:hypothetical protein